MHLSISSSERTTDRAPAPALRGFACFCLFALVGIFSATEWLVRTQVLPQDTYEAHLNLLATNTQADAAFGDSHVARGFDAPDGFANLAYPSENIEDMVNKVTLVYAARDPGRVIIQADPHLFAPYRLGAATQLPQSSRLLVMFSDRHRPRLISYWEAFLRGKGQMNSRVTMTANGSLLSDGDLSLDGPRRRMFDAQTRASWHEIRPSGSVETARIRYARLLDWLSERGATICLVSFPISPNYAQAVADAGHAEQIAFFHTQAKRVGAPFVDARAAVEDLQHFRDIDHLNSTGAREFSPQLLNRCFDDPV